MKLRRRLFFTRTVWRDWEFVFVKNLKIRALPSLVIRCFGESAMEVFAALTYVVSPTMWPI